MSGQLITEQTHTLWTEALFRPKRPCGGLHEVCLLLTVRLHGRGASHST